MLRFLAVALFFALFATNAEASKLYISEYTATGTTGGNPSVAQIAQEDAHDQVVDFSGGVASSVAFAATTRFVRVVCDASCSIVFGASPQNATTSNKFMAAGSAEYFGIIAGQIVSVIANP